MPARLYGVSEPGAARLREQFLPSTVRCIRTGVRLLPAPPPRTIPDRPRRGLFVGRLISGITTSNVSTAFAYVTDVTPPEKRAKAFGMISAAFGIGFVIGPAVGGLLGNHDLRFPFWAAASLSLINALYGFFVLPESLPKERRAKSAWQMSNPVGSLKLLLSHPELAGLAVVVTLYYLAHQSLVSVWALYTEYRFSWSRITVGNSLAVVGV